MFTIYLDESGTHDKTDALAVAGYIATEEQWGWLAREWFDLLRSESISLLHMTDLECFQGEFKGWNKARQIRVLSRAHGIIQRRVRVGISSAVIKSHYDEVIKGELRHRYGKHYYTICALDCMSRVIEWADKYSYAEPIQYVFETGAEGAGELAAKMQDFYDDERTRTRYRLRGWSFEDKREVVQLQAADFIAYETWKQMENRILEGEKRPMRKSLFNLLRASKGTPHFSNYLNRENLSELVANFDRETLA